MNKKLLFLSFVALIFAACGNDKASSNSESVESVPVVNIEEGSRLPIAVVNFDTLLSNYNLAIEANERLMRKQEDATLDLNQRARSLQNEMVDFQNKLENQAFLSRERAESEKRRLLKKQEDLQMLEQQLAQDIMDEQQEITLQMRDSLNSVIRSINATGKYHLIISTSALNDNVLFSASEYDITNEVLEILNSRYTVADKK